MTRFVGKKFHASETTILEGGVFEDCTFSGGRMVYSGGDNVQLHGCKFVGGDLIFDGPARNTLLLLSELYKSGAVELVEGLFEQIRSGNLPQVSGIPTEIQ
jgi:hypothetical protein